MKNIFKALKFPIVFILFLSSLIACDKDFSTIESDVLGEGNANFIVGDTSQSVLAYNKKLKALQINNLASNLLGVFNDSEYGKTTASIITQLTPTTFTEDFGVDPVIDSVVIKIPYFSTVTGTDTDNTSISTYAIDSLYGNQDAPIKLSIYQNNYFLRNFDPSGDANASQNYYSKTDELIDASHNYALTNSQTIDFDNHLGELIYENIEFKTNSNAIELWDESDTDTIITYGEPALRISFKKENDDHTDQIAFWQQTIVAKNGEAELANATNFKNYFRGLYFKAEAIGVDGNMVLLNLNSTNANITIYYSKGESTDRLQDNYVLNFSGNKLNTFINNFDTPLVDGDKDNGDETIYLKGMEGSMAVVNLFGPDTNGDLVPDDLDAFLKEYRKTDDDGEFIVDSNGSYVFKRLINEAHLAIYEDETKVIDDTDDNGEHYHKYDRIYAYDIKNNITTTDYLFDPTDNSSAPVSSKYFSLGQRDSISLTEAKFKIRLTEHLNNIVQHDSTNYQIGLVISNNVNYTSNSEILNSVDDVTSVPSASIISPRGTILYGSNENVPADKRLSLKIFYTKTLEN
ncbi:DUF4270 domain-containing protein [Algibacter sp.]|uniref:DUF4270 domain-containing protein n=1 Tax=Algibacter sp. TaxID=1872428 RepID=UPI003C70C01D